MYSHINTYPHILNPVCPFFGKTTIASLFCLLFFVLTSTSNVYCMCLELESFFFQRKPYLPGDVSLNKSLSCSLTPSLLNFALFIAVQFSVNFFYLVSREILFNPIPGITKLSSMQSKPFFQQTNTPV